MSKIGTGVKKFILIPESYPLHALERVYGPKTGPLSKPTPVLLTVIGELLRQTGKEKVTIYEVVPTQREKRTDRILKFSDPVRLTPENYTLPYEEIVKGGTEENPAVITMSPTQPKVVIEPKKVEIPAGMQAFKAQTDSVIVEIPKDVVEYNAAMTAAAAKAFAESEVGRQTVTVTTGDRTVEGHLDPDQFGDMTDVDLNRLATDLGVADPETKTREELTKAISKVPVQVPVEDEAPAEPETQTVIVETNTDVTVPMTPEEKLVDKMEAEASTESGSKEQVERAMDSENIEESSEAARPVAIKTEDPWLNMTDEERSAYAKMSKAERKEARRAHRAQQ